jgi:hypothetical protein
MAFDMGFDFRATGGYVTDPAYGVPVLAETYPHTYTNSDGYSINGGWDTLLNIGFVDGSTSNDPRIAGTQWFQNAVKHTFIVDLSSGSAPGAGSYALDGAFGQPAGGGTYGQRVVVYDDTSALISLPGPTATSADHFMDLTGSVISATTTWTGTPVTKTFATTTVKVAGGDDSSGDYSSFAHFRLTLQGGGGGGAAPALHSLMLLGVGA